MDETERISVIIALMVVILSIAAIISFVVNQQILFYAFALLAIVAGFYTSYRISKEGEKQQAHKSKKPRK